MDAEASDGGLEPEQALAHGWLHVAQTGVAAAAGKVDPGARAVAARGERLRRGMVAQHRRAVGAEAGRAGSAGARAEWRQREARASDAGRARAAPRWLGSGAGRSEGWCCGRADEAAHGERTLRRFVGSAGAERGRRRADGTSMRAVTCGSWRCVQVLGGRSRTDPWA
jgi:hypothetical protein